MKYFLKIYVYIIYILEPSELIVTLCSIGLYTTALHLCDQFKISKTSVLESLASQCIKLNQHEDPNAWDWLIQNDIFGICFYSKSLLHYNHV